MKKRRFLLIFVFICSVSGAYLLGTFRAKTSVDALREELDSQLAKQSEAAVVKRVSQQMEDIAYQQKAISDQQKERAEEQSAIAQKMRYVAEQESRSAHLAEEKAKRAAADAESERANALRHQMIAEKQRDEANLARSIADTLTYVTLGAQLGQLSIDRYEGGHPELAAKLAYTGWALLEKFKGNTFQPVTYESLSKSSGTVMTYGKSTKGRITAICRINSGFAYVSDYGEIGYCPSVGDEPFSLFSDTRFDFRDILYDGHSIFALSFNSFICKCGLRAEKGIFHLPEDSYLKLMEADDSLIFAVGKKSVSLLDKNRCGIEKHIMFTKTVSTAVKTGEGIIIFFEDGSTSQCDGKLEQIPVRLSGKGTVTAAFCDLMSGLLHLGYGSGEVETIFPNGTTITFPGHSGKISSVLADGNMMISASFDKTIDVRMQSSPYPVTLTYREWPLCLSVLDDSFIVAGFGDGTLKVFNVSPRRMAEKIKDNRNSSLNVAEWEKYVGKNVPYIDF